MPRPHIEEPFQSIANGDRDHLIELLSENPALAQARNDHGESALLFAAYRGHRDFIDLLIEHGAEPTFFEAATIGDLARVERFLGGDPKLLRSHSHDGWTALHLAAHFDHRAVAELLLRLGADVNAASAATSLAPGNRPLHAAIASGHREMAAFLIEHGADPNAPQANGMTALHLAALGHRADFIHLLIDHGANVSAVDHSKLTPLQLAIKHHRGAAAEALRARGAGESEQEPSKLGSV